MVGLSAVVLAVLVAQFAVAGSDEGEIASLQRQINDLKAQVSADAKAAKKKPKAKPGPRGPAGPPGPPGPPGTAPACQGNGSGDAMVAAGSVCIDRYEVSVWSSPTGGTQYGINSGNYPAGCTDTGQGCEAGTAGAIYARSVPGVTPSRFISWFQAQQALANSGKRFPSNAEWQQAVAGTPDPGGTPGSEDCNTTTNIEPTGERTNCISNYGANDMIGNLNEWVGDWVAASTATPGWGPADTFSSDDQMNLAGASTVATGPGTLARGGSWQNGALAGAFAIAAFNRPQDQFQQIGFRGAR